MYLFIEEKIVSLKTTELYCINIPETKPKKPFSFGKASNQINDRETVERICHRGDDQ